MNDLELVARLTRVLLDGNDVTPGQALAVAGITNVKGPRAFRALDALASAGVAVKSQALDGSWHWRIAGSAPGGEQ